MRTFKAACIVLIIIGFSHLLGHFFLLPEFNMTGDVTKFIGEDSLEKKVLELMNAHHRAIGGKSLSFMDIQHGFSLCYALFFFWTGIINLMLTKGLVRNKRFLSQIAMINCGMLLTGAAISWQYFFWLPMISFLSAMILFAIAASKLSREF